MKTNITLDMVNISSIKSKRKKNKSLKKNFSTLTSVFTPNNRNINNHKKSLSLFIENNPFHYKLPIEKKNKRIFSIFSDRKYTRKKLFNSIENFSQQDNLKSEDYKKCVSDLMEKYLYSNPDSDTTNKTHYEITKSKIGFYKRNKEKIEKFLKKSKSNNKFNLYKTSNSKLGFDEENNSTIIKLKRMKYKGPIDSFGLILRNKIIHDKILLNYQDREVQKYGKSINKINILNKFSKLNKKIKITSIIPTILDNEIINYLGINSNNLNSNQNDNENNKLNSNVYLYNQKILERMIYLEINDFIKGSVYLLCDYFRPAKLFPESRDSFCMNYDPISNCIYLFSGNSCDISSNQLWKFNNSKLMWSKIKSNNYISEPRSGHTGVLYKNKYIIFGGQFMHKGGFAELDMFNFETNTWINASTNCLFFKLRRNHIACLIGQQMFIHGGIDKNGEYLDDSYLLNLTPNLSWTKANIIPIYIPPKLAYHSCCLVIPTDILNSNKFSIYKIPNSLLTKKIYDRIKEKGLYVFGGKNKIISNDMWILKIGKKPLEWEKIFTYGKPPCPRYLCSMNFFEKGNFIVIHGGKAKINNGKFALNDTYLFELYRYEWIRVDYGEKESIVKGRFSHCSVICRNKLFIFGGINDEFYNGSNFFIINLDVNKAKDSLIANKNKNMLNKLHFHNSNNFNIIDEIEKKDDNRSLFRSEGKEEKKFPSIIA